MVYTVPKSLTANSKLRYAIGAGNTVIECQPGEGALFPSTYTFYVLLVADDSARTEVVAVTARSTDQFTVTRGQFGTTAVAHPAAERFEMVGLALLLTSGVLTLPSGQDIDLPASVVDKADLNSEVYAIETVCVSGVLDNQTVKIYKCWSACTVVGVTYFTSAALGTNLGIDVIDGATNGAGTDVIDSCSDDLNGLDANVLSTPYAMSAGDIINVKVDDVTNSTFISVVIQLKVPLRSAT